jgi:hypothetical protein
VLGAPPARAGEEGLVETEGGDRPDPDGIVDQRRAVGATASMTVCQSQPSWRATSATVRPSRPTWAVAHRPARSVIPARAGAIRPSVSVHVPPGHTGSGQRQRRLRHTRVAGRPNAGRSTSSTGGRSLTHALVPQPAQPVTSTVVSTCTRSGSPGWSSMPTTVMSGSPTSRAHMRVALVSTGAPEARRCRNHRFSGPLCRARWTPPDYPPTPPLRSEAPVIRENTDTGERHRPASSLPRPFETTARHSLTDRRRRDGQGLP